jgi:hypothetical protein
MKLERRGSGCHNKTWRYKLQGLGACVILHRMVHCSNVDDDTMKV